MHATTIWEVPQIGGGRKLGGYHFEGPNDTEYIRLGCILGSPSFGNYHVRCTFHKPYTP